MPYALLVALGGAVGALARYGVNVAVEARGQPGWIATATVNLVGALLIGLLYSRTTDPQVRALLGVGVLGGFTTFSTFGNDAVGMIAAGRVGLAAGYLGGSVLGGLVGVWLGRALGEVLG